MPRDVDERKKRKALRKLRKAAQLAEQGLGPPLSDWERQFLEEVEQRIETYGSAFSDSEKGNLEEPLSALQNVKLREIDRKARGKGKSGFSRGKKPPLWGNTRQLNDDPPGEVEADQPAPSAKPVLKSVDVGDPALPAARKMSGNGKPAFRVIRGGKD